MALISLHLLAIPYPLRHRPHSVARRVRSTRRKRKDRKGPRDRKASLTLCHGLPAREAPPHLRDSAVTNTVARASPPAFLQNVDQMPAPQGLPMRAKKKGTLPCAPTEQI